MMNTTQDARKALKPAYHNRKVTTFVERKLIREVTQGLDRFAATPAKAK